MFVCCYGINVVNFERKVNMYDIVYYVGGICYEMVKWWY